MSYEVTATRRRPQRLGDLVGQEFVAETLKNSINSGKIAHAYLFSGPRGCGKTSTARILAKALNCANGPAADPCCQCSNCQEITKGSSLDVIEIDGASNTSVENIRQIKDEVLFPPSNCRYKIYIIDEVHMLSTSAFNALLKTIEEPPPYVIFIFATTELQKVPATIKSRCQQFNFRLVAIDKVKQCLAEAAAELGIQADEEALFWIARESTGSMRDAYTLFDQVVAFSDGYITYEKIRDKLGLVGIERLNSIFEACAANSSDAVINMLDEFLQGGISTEQLISNCADYLRSLLLIKSGITKEALLGNSAERYSRNVLNAWNSVQIERALSIFLNLYRDIRYSLSPRYELELAFSRLCWIGQYVSNMEVRKAIDAAQALLMGAGNGNAAVNGGINGDIHTGAVSARPAAASGAGAAGSMPVNSALEIDSGVSAAFGSANGGNPAGNAGHMSVGNVVQSGASDTFGFAAGGAGGAGAFDGGSSASDPLAHNSSAQEENRIPNGLPRLSMLDSMDDGDSEQASEGDAANPFYDGGSLPPEQSVNFEAAQTASEGEQVGSEPVLDERLKINISAQNFQGDQIVPTAELPADDGFGYTLNPDELDDENWSNVDEPPPEPFYDEEEYAKEVALSYEASLNQGQEAAPVFVSSDKIMISGQAVSLSDFHDEFISRLSAKDGFAASALEKTANWKLNGTVIEAEIYSEYEYSLLEKKIQIINGELKAASGGDLQFKASIVKKQVEEAKSAVPDVPPQVRLLVNVFKGTILGREN